MALGFIVWSSVAVLFLGIGLSCRKSQEAVGFFTFVKPPAIKNIKEYNRAVSILWFVAAFFLEIIGIPFCFLEQNSPYFLFIAFACMILAIGMMAAYLKIETTYKKQ